MTFRRSSTTPFNNQSTAQSTPATDGAAVQAPPSAADAAPYDGPLRYTREQLLEISRNSESAINVEELFVSGWVPAPVNGTSVRNWGKPNETHVPQDPSVCWDTNGAVKPVGLQEMSQEEKEVGLRPSFCWITTALAANTHRPIVVRFRCQLSRKTPAAKQGWHTPRRRT